MDARAFAAATRRTYLRDPRVTAADGAFVLAATGVVLVLLAISSWMGWLRLLLG
jgi:energy-coupling factor transporter transmembrane protein EcfT